MGREKELYRNNLEQIVSIYGNAGLITLKQASEYISIAERVLKSDNTFPVKKVKGRYMVSIVALASWLS